MPYRGAAAPSTVRYATAISAPLPLDDGTGLAEVTRSEKFVAVNGPVYEVSAFTDFTYDTQRIGTPGGIGYKYNFVVRQGVTGP